MDATGISTVVAPVKRGTTVSKHIPIVVAPHPHPTHPFHPFQNTSRAPFPRCHRPPWPHLPGGRATVPGHSEPQVDPPRAPTLLKRIRSCHQWVGSGGATMPHVHSTCCKTPGPCRPYLHVPTPITVSLPFSTDHKKPAKSTPKHVYNVAGMTGTIPSTTTRFFTRRSNHEAQFLFQSSSR